MGCDIHLHTEVKIKSQWHHYGMPDVTRDYRVFAKMAGIHNKHDITPITKPRGMPVDPTFLTAFDCELWGSDGHSHSWLTAEEITTLVEFIKDKVISQDNRWPIKWPEANFSYFFGGTWGGFSRYRNEPNAGIPEGVEDIRFVFWFDDSHKEVEASV